MHSSEDEASYRKQVQRYVKARQLSPDDIDALEDIGVLETYRAYYKLLPSRARAIRQEVLSQTTASPPTSNSAPTGTGSPIPSESQSRGNGSSPLSSNSEVDSNSNLEKSPAQSADSVNQTSQGHDSEKDAEAVSVPTTVIPPKQSEDYFAYLQQYGQEFLQAHQTEGFYLSEETRERLHKLAKQHELVGTDVADIERRMLVGLYLTSKPPAEPSEPVLPTEPVEEKYDAELAPDFEELEGSLKAGDFRTADEYTLEILLKLLKRPLYQFLLDEVSLRKFSPKSQDKKAIQEIDRLWSKYSGGKLGFARQLELYGFNQIPLQATELNKRRDENKKQAIAFSKSVRWWINRLEFYKFYNQLNFTAEAPTGHLPALWFWEIPWQQVLQYGGLFILEQRGGCRADAFTLPAFMYMLKVCGVKPHL